MKRQLATLLIWTAFAVTVLLAEEDGVNEDEPQNRNALAEDFIRVVGMRMTEYNFWLPTESHDECAQRCLEETRFYCMSFSYSASAAGCGVYENSRANAPSNVYGPPISQMTETGFSPSWVYYERKPDGYKILEEKMNVLENLTEIDLEFAKELMKDLGNSLVIGGEDDGSGDDSLSPSELNLISKMVQRIIVLNPSVNATPEVAEEFAKALMNVSDSMMQPNYFALWEALQQDPTCSGIAGIVTSAEIAGRDVSDRLLGFSNSTSIVAESERIGMWLDIVHYPEVSPPTPLFGFGNIAEDLMEKIAKVFNEHHDKSYIFPQKNKLRRRNNPFSSRDSVLNGDEINLPSSALKNRSVVTHVRYKNLQQIIPTRHLTRRHPAKGTSYSIITSVLTTSVYPKPAKHIFEEDPVTIIFKHTKTQNMDESEMKEESTSKSPESQTPTKQNNSTKQENIKNETFCVFWMEGNDDIPGGWSDAGCKVESSNATHTICECKHLTSFAVLLKMVDSDEEDPSYWVHNRALSYISYIGCVLSLIGVSIMCTAFVLLKFHTENMKIHFNLGLAVGAADCVFLFEEYAQEKHYSCVLVTILLYYSNLAVLSWMLIEGLFLYSQVVIVFVSARRWVRYYLVAGWGIPAIVMGISMGILNVQLGTNKICWLSPVDNSIWAFAAPAILVIFINFVILISVVRVIVKIQPDQTNNMKISRVKNAVKGSIFLSPLLGTTWLFGLLSLSHETLLFQYLFATTNSLQGFFLFLFHCLCNSEVRADFARRRSRKPLAGSFFNGRSQPWFTRTFGLGVASGLRKFRNSISFDFGSLSHSTSDNAATQDSKYIPKQKFAVIGEESEQPSSPERETSDSNEFKQRNQEESANESEQNEGKHEENQEDSGCSDKKVESLTKEQRSLSKILDKKPCVSLKSNTLPPILSMPVKNDVIIASRCNKISPISPKKTKGKLSEKDEKPKTSEDNNNPNDESKKYDHFHAKGHDDNKVKGDRHRKEPIEYEETQKSPEHTPTHRDCTDDSNETDLLESILRNQHPGENTESQSDEKPDSIQDSDIDDQRKEAHKIAMSYDSGLNSIDNESLLDAELDCDEMPYGNYVVGNEGFNPPLSAWEN